MSHVARERFFGVHGPDPPACIHVDTETSTSLLTSDLRIVVKGSLGPHILRMRDVIIYIYNEIIIYFN